MQARKTLDDKHELNVQEMRNSMDQWVHRMVQKSAD